MNWILKKLAFVTILSATITVVGEWPNGDAFAQTAAPSAVESLPEGTVKAMQDALNRQGITVTANGVLNDETRAAIRQYQSQHHLAVTGEPDKATLDKLGVGVQATDEAFPAQAMSGTAPGMGMMTPEMMQMMTRMMGGMGQGMMGQGQMPMARSMMMCPMMQMMMGARSEMEMPGMMGGLGMLYGMPVGTPEEMTPERVRAFLEQGLARQGNPRLKLGEIGAAADGSVTAEIVTVDGSLVQKLAFNRYPGLVRQVD